MGSLRIDERVWVGIILLIQWYDVPRGTIPKDPGEGKGGLFFY